MPSARKNSVLTLRAIDGKEIQWLMVSVGQAHRNHDVAGLDVGELAERLLKPELLKFHLSTFLHFLLILNSFLCLVFD